MAISRFQMNRQLRAYGGIMGQDGRRNYGIGSFFQKKIMDPIKKVAKSDVGKAAAAAALGYGLNTVGIPGTSGISKTGQNIGKGSISSLFRGLGIGGGKDQSDTADAVKSGIGSIFTSPRAAGAESVGIDPRTGLPLPIPTDEKGFLGKTVDFFTKDRLGTDKSIADLLMTPQALAIGSGLLAGAFTKDKEDPIYTGQDVGLNLQDIAKLANISDPKTAAAIGLRFSPDVEARKFTPAEMAATYAANQPVDFTEKRQQAQEGGMMGDQKDFEQFLQDMKDRDMGMMQDQILRDFENYMKRKRMIENLPEAKDGGLMNARPKMASAILGDESDEISMRMFGKPVKELNPDEFRELMDYLDDLQKSFRAKGGRVGAQEGGMMDLGGMEMDLRGGGFVPMGRAEKADDVPARLSKNEFVFTADAVRAAGGGNVDKGADKMYATMKRLEDRIA